MTGILAGLGHLLMSIVTPILKVIANPVVLAVLIIIEIVTAGALTASLLGVIGGLLTGAVKGVTAGVTRRWTNTRDALRKRRSGRFALWLGALLTGWIGDAVTGGVKGVKPGYRRAHQIRRHARHVGPSWLAGKWRQIRRVTGGRDAADARHDGTDGPSSDTRHDGGETVMTGDGETVTEGSDARHDTPTVTCVGDPHEVGEGPDGCPGCRARRNADPAPAAALTGNNGTDSPQTPTGPPAGGHDEGNDMATDQGAAVLLAAWDAVPPVLERMGAGMTTLAAEIAAATERNAKHDIGGAKDVIATIQHAEQAVAHAHEVAAAYLAALHQRWDATIEAAKTTGTDSTTELVGTQ